MIGPSSGTKLWIVAGTADLRKGPNSLVALVQNQLLESPFSGELYIFRGRRGDKIKILWFSQDGWCLFYKRLSDGKFIWPRATAGTVSLSSAQLSMLLEGIDWRRPKRHSVALGSGSNATETHIK